MSLHLPPAILSATAKTFYAAGLFFEVLKQFGDLQPEVRGAWQKDYGT